VSVNVVLCEVPSDPLPVTVTVAVVLDRELGPAWKVRADVAGEVAQVIGFTLKLAVTPFGRPPTFKLTEEA